MGLQPPRRGLNGVVGVSLAAYRDGVEELSDDVVAFLSEGTRTGLLGYLASDGRARRSIWQSDCARGAFDAATEAAPEPGQQR